MKKEIRYSGVLRVFLLFFMGLLLQFNNVTLAQNTTEKGAQISDESAPNALTPITFSILELSSKERGFLMPRMTTVERMRIPTANLSGGMVIFNTTLDCVEFYNASRQQWMNICGGNDPAVYTIPELKCGTAKASGTYTAGVLLDERKNIITIEVSVSSPGSFDIEAIAYDDTTQLNGYTFSAHGTFPTEGSFVIVLRGKGTPKKGYATGAGKDKIKFFLNKKLVTCEISNDVAKDFEPLVANLLCTDVTNKINVEGTYKEKVPLTAANRITVPVKVTKSGRGKVYGKVEKTTTQTENVLYESDVTDFVVTPSNGVQWVVLKPAVNTGKPTTGGNMKVDLKIVSKGKNEYDPFVPADPKDISTCSFNINVESDGVKFNLDKLQLASYFVGRTGAGVGIPYITPRTDMGVNGSGDFVVHATITAKGAGQYEIKTNTVNGVYFYGKGDIPVSKVGTTYTVPLMAYGKSGTDQPAGSQIIKATGNNLDASYTNVSKPLAVDFVYRPMRMYSIGNESWHPGGYPHNWAFQAGPTMVRALKNFGWNGQVRIDGLNFVGIDNPQGTALGDSYSNNDLVSNTSITSTLATADMVFVGARASSSYNKTTARLVELANYAKYNNGVVVFGESIISNLTDFYGVISSGYTATTSNTNGSPDTDQGYYIYDFNLSQTKQILGSEARFGSLSGTKISGHSKGSSTAWKTVPSGFLTFAADNSKGETFGIVHQSLGIVGIGASTFMGGTMLATGNTGSYPSRGNTSGDPLTAPYAGGPMYNSTLLLNLVHWAIDYAQEHQPNEIKP